MLQDGGWLSTCDGTMDGCSGHIEPQAPIDGADTMGLNHHHHYGESNSGILSTPHGASRSGLVTIITLRPLEAHCLVGCFSLAIDEPPRI